MTYYLYARKSTDVEDKQVRSIDDQLAVLRSLAKAEGLEIAGEFVEKQSAKKPGRPVFNDMMNRIERGEAQGILCWKIDRLARNPVDGLRVIWMLQQNGVQHIRTHERNYYPADNMLLLYIEFGMANQYIRDLSMNTKRGQMQKAKRGEYPALLRWDTSTIRERSALILIVARLRRYARPLSCTPRINPVSRTWPLCCISEEYEPRRSRRTAA